MSAIRSNQPKKRKSSGVQRRTIPKRSQDRNDRCVDEEDERKYQKE